MARVPCQLAVVACLSLFLATCVAHPTTESLVIARNSDVTEVAETSTAQEVVTEEHTPPIKLTEMDVKSQISMRYAHTAVVAYVRNPAKKSQEANFRVLLPETAFISGFVMTINGKAYKAYVKEKEEAKQIYNAAVSQGIGAAHIAAKVRDSNHFTVSVNVEPTSLAVFNLTYEELLPRRNGVYNHAINLHPGALVPKFTITINIAESANITELRVPEIRTGNEIDATKEDAALSNAIITRSGSSAVISFAPDLDEQKRLMAVYQEKSKKSSSEDGILGQFVVQYDVDRPNTGEVLVNDGYFVHFFAPNDLPPLHKHVVFVLDTSGSMMGRKMEQLQTAMQTILTELNPGDYFSIVDFDSTVSVHDLAEADQEPKRHSYFYGAETNTPSLIAPSQATKENIDKARVIIQRLEAYGGTNIASALDTAVNLINKRAELTQAKNNNGSTPAPTTEVATKTEKATNEEAVTLEPMIIFLTDGDPTVGETNTNTIINHITEKNYGVNKAALFSLAFGEDADRKFLRKLALRNDGFMRHIYEASDAALQLRDFYRQVSSPVLADVKFVYPPDQIKENTLTKNKFRAYYAGSEMVVAGEIADTATELEPETLGFCGVIDDSARKKYEKKIKVPVNKNTGYLPLERLWAYLSIKQLLDDKDASDEPQGDKTAETPEKKALALALKYAFVTPLTSLVVVKPNETSAVDAESVDKQVSGGFPGAFGLQNSYIQPLYAFARPMSPLSSGIYPSSISASPGFGAALSAPSFDYGLQANSISGRVKITKSFGSYPHSRRAYHKSFGSSSHAYSHKTSSSYNTHTVSDNITPQVQVNNPGLANSLSGFRSSISYSPRRAYYHSYRGALSSGHFNPPHSGFFRSGISTRFSSEEPEEEALNVDGAAIATPDLSVATSAPAFTTTVPVPTTTLPVTHYYALDDYPWTTDLLNLANDTLTFTTDVTVTLKVVRGTTAPKLSSPDPECATAVGGGSGLCVYLTRCKEARNITLDTYKTTYCSAGEGYAGVCCSTDEITAN